MSKKRIAGIAALVLAVVSIIGMGSVYAANAIAKNNSIGEQAAINFAYMDAGATSKEAKDTTCEFEFEHGQYIYEVEFVFDNMKYEYDIKASNGKILGKEMERIKAVVEEATKVIEETAEPETETKEDEKETEVKETKAPEEELDKDDASDDKDDIDDDKDDVDDDDDDKDVDDKDDDDDDGIIAEAKNSETEKPSTKYISVEKAKKIALNDAGVKSKDVTFKKAKLEKEDGIYVYDIEFMYGTTEYEYEINAMDGSIVEASYELENDISEDENNLDDDDDDDDDDNDDDDDDDDDDDEDDD